MNRKLLKEFLPPVVTRYLTGFFYGWHGNYKNWAAAMEKCTGYDSGLIFEKVKTSSMMVKSGKVKFERDSVMFDVVEYNYAVVSAFLWIATLNKNRIRVLDFGGALGSLYYQNRLFLDSLAEVKWCIVEQPGFVEIGKNEFASDRLSFYSTIDECLADTTIDVIFMSGVLPYVEDPYSLLRSVISKKFQYILFNRTPFIKGQDRLTVQKVKPEIYKASYPAWFFNLDKFTRLMNEEYDEVFRFDNDDRANIRSEFKGLLYRRRV